MRDLLFELDIRENYEKFPEYFYDIVIVCVKRIWPNLFCNHMKKSLKERPVCWPDFRKNLDFVSTLKNCSTQKH